MAREWCVHHQCESTYLITISLDGWQLVAFVEQDPLRSATHAGEPHADSIIRARLISRSKDA